MPENNNVIKPIMVADISLTQLEQCWDSAIEDSTEDKASSFAELLSNFFLVCERLRKEVKRHKKAKKNLSDAQELVTEYGNQLVAKDAEIAALKQELAALRETHYGDNPGLRMTVTKPTNPVVLAIRKEMSEEGFTLGPALHAIERLMAEIERCERESQAAIQACADLDATRLGLEESRQLVNKLFNQLVETERERDEWRAMHASLVGVCVSGPMAEVEQLRARNAALEAAMPGQHIAAKIAHWAMAHDNTEDVDEWLERFGK